MYRARMQSPFGPMLLCGGGRGLAGLYFADQQDCPLADGGPAAGAKSFGPSSGVVNGVALNTLRPSRRGGRSDIEGSPGGQMSLFSGGQALSGAEPLAQVALAGNDLDRPSEAGTLAFLQEGTPVDVVDLFGNVQAELIQYFAGARKGFDFPLALAGTAFQLKVWKALCLVPYGEVVSYGQLAAMAGFTPGHGRPVGTAVGRNPVSIVVPCHRIIGSNGALTGYTGGLSRKVGLLELEGFEFG